MLTFVCLPCVLCVHIPDTANSEKFMTVMQLKCPSEAADPADQNAYRGPEKAEPADIPDFEEADADGEDDSEQSEDNFEQGKSYKASYPTLARLGISISFSHEKEPLGWNREFPPKKLLPSVVQFDPKSSLRYKIFVIV